MSILFKMDVGVYGILTDRLFILIIILWVHS